MPFGDVSFLAQRKEKLFSERGDRVGIDQRFNREKGSG